MARRLVDSTRQGFYVAPCTDSYVAKRLRGLGLSDPTHRGVTLRVRVGMKVLGYNTRLRLGLGLGLGLGASHVDPQM